MTRFPQTSGKPVSLQDLHVVLRKEIRDLTWLLCLAGVFSVGLHFFL